MKLEIFFKAFDVNDGQVLFRKSYDLESEKHLIVFCVKLDSGPFMNLILVSHSQEQRDRIFDEIHLEQAENFLLKFEGFFVEDPQLLAEEILEMVAYADEEKPAPKPVIIMASDDDIRSFSKKH